MQTELVMDRLNRALYSVTPSHQFMSFLYGVLDTEAMTFTYTNAGHPTPLCVRQGVVTSLTYHGMLLGINQFATYDHSVIRLSANDILVLFSDGIIEAMSRNRQMFRNDGIISAIKSQIDGSAQNVMQAIWRNFESHSVGGQEPDDRTLLVIKMLKD